MADKRTCQAIVKSTGKPCTNDAIGGNGEFCGIHCKCPVRNLLGLKCGEKFFPGFQLCQKHHTLDKQKKKTKPLTAATIQPPPTLAFILSDPVFDGIKVTGVNDFISGDSVNTGATLLHVAAGNDRADLIEKLVGLGADVNIQAEKTLSTPLHWAVGKHKIKAVRMLRQLGADPILPNNSSKKVIDVARTESHPKDRSADTDTTPSDRLHVVRRVQRAGSLQHAPERRGHTEPQCSEWRPCGAWVSRRARVPLRPPPHRKYASMTTVPHE